MDIKKHSGLSNNTQLIHVAIREGIVVISFYHCIFFFQKSLIQPKNPDRPQRLIFAKQNGHIPQQQRQVEGDDLSAEQHSPASPVSRTTTSLNSSSVADMPHTDCNNSSDGPWERHAHLNPEVQQRIRKLENFETSFSMVLKAMSDSLRKNEARLSASEDRDYVKREWQQVALVVDRLLLFIFMLMTVGVTLGLLLRGTITYALAIQRSNIASST